MKKLIKNYSFSPSLKQVTFKDYAEIVHGGVLLVTNATDGIIIYNFADPLKGGTVSSNVLTLEYDTASMDAADALQVWYDDGNDLDISYAMDKTNNMPLFVEQSNKPKFDELGAQIPSDAPKEIVWQSSTAAVKPLTIDTTGYQSIVIHKTTAGIITPYTSNDLNGWFAVMGYTATAPQTMTATLPAATGVYIFPVTGRYFRLVGPATYVQCTIYLRNVPCTLSSIGTVSTVTTLSQFAGTAIVNAGVAGMLAVGGNIAAGAAPTANPIQIGGVDAGRLNTPGAVAAGLTPKTRRALVDELGRFIAPNMDISRELNFENSVSAFTRDVTQHEGQSIIEVLAHILVELRTLNWQIHELPNSIGATTMAPNDDLDEVRTEMKAYNYSN